VTTDVETEDRKDGLLCGPLIADALAMAGHWYYDRAALYRDYGELRDYQEPRNPHPDSILWRSRYEAPGPKGDILRDQARFWGQRGIHYHQFLSAGENTLNFQLLHVLDDSLERRGGYHLESFLEGYVDFMLTPGRHRETYVEEHHRQFFGRYGRGWKPLRCGGRDIHIGGLAPVGLLCARMGDDLQACLEAVETHVGFSHGDPGVMDAARALTRMLLAVLAGDELREAILRYGTTWISKAKLDRWLPRPDDQIIGQVLSPACYIRDAFAASLYLAWKYADDVESALITNTMVGGDNCHRGAVVGALVGAAVGKTGLPKRWVAGLKCPVGEGALAGKP
jgi:ADP-ribosylglycohydrolase